MPRPAKRPVVQPRILYAPEAAVYCGRSQTEMDELRAKGEGPRFIRIGETGRGIRYDVRDLDRWLDEQPRFDGRGRVSA